MAKISFDAPIFSLTPGERAEREALLDQNLPTDTDTQYMYDSVGGGLAIAGRDTGFGTVAARLGMFIDDSFSDEASDPLNLTKNKTQYNPTSDPLSFGGDNNPEGISETLKSISGEDWPWLLSSNSYSQFVNRALFVKAGLPEAQQMVSGASRALAVGLDLTAMIAAGVAAEPLAIAGLGARGSLASRAALASRAGRRVQDLSQAAGEAAATISRMNLTARFGALGVAEEAVYHGVRNGLDPVYDPSATSVMLQIAGSGAIAGLVGGAAFGRAFVRSHIEDAANEFRRTRRTELPGGYTISYTDHFQFGAPAAADQMLFAPSARSLADETARIGRELGEDYRRRGALGVLDENIPGTRTIPIGEVPVAGTPRVVREGAVEVVEDAQRPLKPTIGTTAKPSMGIRSAIKAAAFELDLAGVQLTDEVFAMLGRVLVNTNNKRVTAGAFNKAFWEEVATNLPPESAARIRPVAERTFIPGIDRTVKDAVDSENMVESVWNHFRAGVHLEAGKEPSLIFQVLQEIRARGGMVNREVVGEVIDELRTISQKAPKKVNSKGKTVMDKNARRLAVINVINKRTETLKRGATSANPISIPASLLDRMNVRTTGAIGAGGAIPPAGGGGGTRATGGPANFSDVPQLRQFLTERIPLVGALFNQAARVMESDNGAARLIAWMSFNARRSLNKAQPETIFEAGTAVLHKTMFTFSRGYRNGYIRFALGRGVENVDDPGSIMNAMRTAFGNRELRRDFNRRVAKQLRTGAFDDALGAVNETAQGFRQIFNTMHEMAAEVGLKGFTKAATVNYMPRLWRFDKIRRLATTEAGRRDLTALIKKAIDQNGRKVVIDGVEEVFTDDVGEAAIAFSNRLINIAKNAENAPLTAQDQELFDALKDLLGPIKAKTASRTPFGRGRLLLDEQASITPEANHFNDGSTAMGLADLLNDDLPFVFRKYATSVLGSINEKRLLTGFNDELRLRGVFAPTYTTARGDTITNAVEVNTVEEMLSLANKLGEPMSAGEMDGLREVIAAIRYEPINRGASGIGDKTLGVALPLGYLTTGGQFGLAALGELSRIVGTLGLRNTIKQMPILTEMLSNWKNLDLPAQNFASFIDSWFAPSTDRLRRALLNPDIDAIKYSEMGAGNIAYTGVKKALDSTSNFMSDLSGLTPITSFTQQLTAATSLQHLYDVAKGTAKRLDPATVRTLGLEPDQYEAAIRFVGDNARTENKFLGERIVDMTNLDRSEMDFVKTFVNRMVRTRVQDMATRGDFHKLAFTFVGRLLTQFRTFNLKGVDNFLIQNAGRMARGGGAKVAQEVSSTLMLAGLIQYGRNYADWRSYKAANNKKKVEETEKNLGIGGFIRGAMTGPAEFFLLTNITDAVWTSTISPDPLFSSYRYSGLGLYGFPGEAMAKRAYSVFNDVYGATAGKAMGTGLEQDITEGTVHKGRLLLPGQNLPGIKQLLNVFEEDISVEWNLSRNQPRKTRD